MGVPSQPAASFQHRPPLCTDTQDPRLDTFQADLSCLICVFVSPTFPTVPFIIKEQAGKSRIIYSACLEEPHIFIFCWRKKSNILREVWTSLHSTDAPAPSHRIHSCVKNAWTTGHNLQSSTWIWYELGYQL